jgi:hypothetical protein
LGPTSKWVSVRWRGPWPRATWWRGWPAAPVGTDLGPSGAHLGRGGQAGLRATTKLPGGGEVRWQTCGGSVKAGLLQRGCGVFVGLFGPGRASVGLVLPCCRVRSATEMAVEVVPSGSAAMLLPTVLLSHFLSSRSHVGGHGEMTRMT